MKKIIQSRGIGKTKGHTGITVTIQDRQTATSKSFTIHGYDLEEAYNLASLYFFQDIQWQNNQHKEE